MVDGLAEHCGLKLRKPQFLSRYEMAKGSFQGRGVALVKPLTFMNRSGEVMRSVLRHTRAGREDLLIICDNLDLAPGVLKMKLTGSSGGHRGLDSIFSVLKTSDIARLSIGIGRPPRRGGVVDHVLGDPERGEADVLEQAVAAAVAAVLRLLKEPPERVMGDVNRRVKRDAQT